MVLELLLAAILALSSFSWTSVSVPSLVDTALTNQK